MRFLIGMRDVARVEPEGLMTNEVYPNGISTSLPYEVQQDFIRSIKGFENVDIGCIVLQLHRCLSFLFIYNVLILGTYAYKL
jgi:hypothetical protein